MRPTWKLPLTVAIFILCIAPTFVSYASYTFRWDDSDYLSTTMAASRAFWSGHRHELGLAMRGSRPPIMSFLGLPWGPLTSWSAAGKCFISLAAFNAFFVVCALFLLLRLGLKPLYLIIASLCVFAALGPFPAGADAHFTATAMLADSLFAWIAFSAVLLISYEAATETFSLKDSLLRGLFWSLILCAGALTKVSFLYFIASVLPVLLFVRFRRAGLLNLLLTFLSFIVCSLPVILYWLLYGQSALSYGFASSFGYTSKVFYVPLFRFLAETFRQSPGMLLSIAFTIACLVYFLAKEHRIARTADLLPILIMLGYAVITLSSSNREIRFLFPAIISMPFLVALLISRQTFAVPRQPAVAAAMFAFLLLVVAAIPTLRRANIRSTAYGEAVLAQASASNAKRIILATNSSTLNGPLMNLAIAISPAPPPIQAIIPLGYRAASRTPVEDDFRDISQCDLVVFQSADALDSSYVNPRLPEYELFARQQFGGDPIATVSGLRFYALPHSQR
ncbi:MAG: hypothetical protein WCE52_02385 [Candidatus Acidiferrum sp.]